MTKLNIFFLFWCSFFTVFDIVMIVMFGVTPLRVFCLILQATVFTIVFIENKEYIKKTIRNWILKDLQ